MPSRRDALILMGQAALAAGAFPVAARGAVPTDASTDAGVDFAALAKRMDGTIVLPASNEYDAARRTFSFNPRTDRRPAAIARCASEADVAASVEFARASGLEIAVRSGGHDVLSASTCDGGLVIDLAALNSARLDEDSGMAFVGPGIRQGALDYLMADKGRVLAMGCNPQVGVAGLTLGGGLGWFVGSLGAACDYLDHARVVTADGSILTVSEDSHPELLWALRGGGGNFGVVVELGLRSHPLDTVTGGFLCLDGRKLPEFLRFYRDYMADAPDALVLELTIMSPARPVIFVMASYIGDPRDAQRALAPLRAFDTPLADGWRNARYPDVMWPTSEVQEFFRPDPAREKEANDAPGSQWLGGSLDELDDAAIETIAGLTGRAPGNWAFNIGHHMHGAVCRVTDAASPLPRPRGTFTYNVAAWWSSAASATAQLKWVDDAAAAMRAHETATYINYLSRDDAASVRQSYGESYPPLQAVKRRYDPDNVFHRNRNIAPGAS